VFSFSRAGYFNATKPFELIEYIINENSYLVWRIVIDNFKYLLNILHSTDTFETFKSYLLKLFTKMYIKLHEEEEEDVGASDM
jgi:hypothetical protein